MSRLPPEQYKEYETNQQPLFTIRSSACESGDAESICDRRHKNENDERIRSNPENQELREIQHKIVAAMFQEGFLLMHGAAVAKDGEAYLFTAPSGTGKTTRLRFWMELYPESIIINGDKPLICLTGPRLLACGTPWAGKEGWNSNIQVPIRAIFLLERAEKDSVTEIQIAEAMLTLLRQTYTSHTFQNAQKWLQMLKIMEGKVRFFRYRSTMTAESVRMAYEAAQAAGPIG